MQTDNNDLLTRLTAVAREAWAAGYAITFWSPDEVGDASQERLTDLAIERGNEYLSDMGECSDEEEE